jgi:DNA end-binding protein Ku
METHRQMRKALPIALAAFAVVMAAAVAVLRRAHAERVERVVSERPLDTLTRDKLYELARELDIPGRSRMTKPELRAAVSRAGRSD